MKKYKLLLALPALATMAMPLTACQHPKKTEISIVGDKELTTPTYLATFSFSLSDYVAKELITFTMSNETLPSGGIADRYIVLDGRDLYFVVEFNDYSYSKYSFDITFDINGSKTTISGLSVTLIPLTNELPREALVINNGVLEGLNPEFSMLSIYNTLAIPSDVTSIKKEAFKDTFTSEKNANITNIKFNKELTSIGNDAFNGCKTITSLDVSLVPVSKTACPIEIGTDAFAGWAAAGTIKYSANNETPSYDLLDFALCDQGLEAGWFNTVVVRPTLSSHFVMSADGKTVLRFKWDTIGAAPRHVRLLVNELLIPREAVAIEANAFFSVASEESLIPTNIKYLSFHGNEVLESIGSNAFANSNLSLDEYKIGYLFFPESLTYIGQNAFANTKFTSVGFEKNLTTISKGAFKGCPFNKINLLNLTEKPEGWSSDETFTDEVTYGTGQIILKPAMSLVWKEYFITKLGFSTTRWVIDNEIDLTESYSAVVAPASPVTFADADAAASTLKTSYAQSPILIDDIAFTLHDSVKEEDFKSITVQFTKAQCDFNGLNLTITWKAVTTDNKEWSGTWRFVDLSLNSTPAIQKTQGVMKFTFGNIFDLAGGMLITQKEGTGTATTTSIWSNDDLTSANLGILDKLGWFDTTAKTISINSRYLGECTVG